MPLLYRCRTALSEVAGLFGAEPPERADWSAELWPGRTGLIVRADESGRRIEAMRWDLPGSMVRTAETRQPSLWYREWRSAGIDVRDPANRCLIVLDSFALPDGPSGARTRTWYGFDDVPIFAWAGLWTSDEDASSFSGFQVSAPPFLGSRRVMPAIVRPSEYDIWLGGDWRVASDIVQRVADDDTLYREPTEQPWGADRTL